MEKHRAIPIGYMTVGEVAKKAGTTVRTLQYYDKEGVLTPSSESEGGRRLYTHKDMVRLYYIQSMKYLGFSLDDIKNKLPQINTPQEVSAALTNQAKGVREMIDSLKDVLESIEMLNSEVLLMESVDWKKYAEIVGVLHLKNSGYWIIKHMDGSVMEYIMENFDNAAATQLHEKYAQIVEKSVKTQQAGHPPHSAEAAALAKEWWDYAMEITKGDPSIMSELIEMGKKLDNDEWSAKFSFDKEYLEKALSIHFANIGHDPFNPEGKG